MFAVGQRQVQSLINTAQSAARLHILPLHYASLRGQLEVARLLIKCREDVNSPINYEKLKQYHRKKSSESGAQSDGVWGFGGSALLEGMSGDVESDDAINGLVQKCISLSCIVVSVR